MPLVIVCAQRESMCYIDKDAHGANSSPRANNKEQTDTGALIILRDPNQGRPFLSFAGLII